MFRKKLHASGYVLMGNNVKLMNFEIGTVKIRMFDEIVRTLPDDMHVPRKNLILWTP